MPNDLKAMRIFGALKIRNREKLTHFFVQLRKENTFANKRQKNCSIYCAMMVG